MPKINCTVMHLVFAFLCVKNRNATMCKHSCNEWVLFENPNWLLSHYFENSGAELSEIERNEIIEFIETRNGRQIAEAFLCPVNRHCTRIERECSDEDFINNKNYEHLIGHYIMNGGAEAFAKKRKEKTVKIAVSCS